MILHTIYRLYINFLFLKEKGSSLIELLVAISLIAILTSLAIPSFKVLLKKFKTKSSSIEIGSESKCFIVSVSDSDQWQKWPSLQSTLDMANIMNNIHGIIYQQRKQGRSNIYCFEYPFSSSTTLYEIKGKEKDGVKHNLCWSLGNSDSTYGGKEHEEFGILAYFFTCPHWPGCQNLVVGCK